MEINWHGDTCFTLKNKTTNIVIDPHREAGKLKGDIVLLSGSKPPVPMEGVFKTFDWPGEYEIKDIPITGFQAWTKGLSKASENGATDKTIIFYLEIEGLKICHLGELGHVLTSDMLKEIGDVDILMIKVGKESNLDSKKAIEIIEAIEPRVVIPMGLDNPANALKDIAADKTEIIDKFVIKSASELPEDQMKCVVLKTDKLS